MAKDLFLYDFITSIGNYKFKLFVFNYKRILLKLGRYLLKLIDLLEIIINA